MKPALLLGATALTAAVLVGAVVKVQLSQNKAPDDNMIQIAAADKDLPLGHALDIKDISWQQWPADHKPKGAITKTDAEQNEDLLQDVRLRGAVLIGEPIREDNLVSKSDKGFLSASLGPGMRAMSIPVSAPTSVAGFVQPGDRVDVILTYEVRISGGLDKIAAGQVVSRFASETVLTQVRVLAVDQEVETKGRDVKPGRTVTLEVNRAQAEKLALSGRMGELSLSLRGMGDETSEPSTFTPDLAVGDALRAASEAGRREARPLTVRVYNGSTHSTIEVKKRQ